MAISFVAYIDESGDPGIKRVKPNNPDGASEWLVLCCYLVRIENDNSTLSWVREILSQFRNRQSPYLHFADLILVKKRIACETIAKKPGRFFVAMSNKKNIENYRNLNIPEDRRPWLYWWMARLLLERVTDFCDSHVPETEKGDHKLRIIFSRRGGLKYADFDHYLRKIRRQSQAKMLVINQGDFKWSVIDLEEIFVLDHKERAGLQLADIGASAFYQAVNQDRPDGCDPQFAKLLRGVMAEKKAGHILNYGIKTMPDLHEMMLNPKQREIFEFYGYSKEGW